MCRRGPFAPAADPMEKSAIKTAVSGDASTLVLSLTHDLGEEDRQFYAVPVAVRSGGILLAIPVDAYASEALAAGQTAEDDAILGPSTILSIELLEEDENLAVQPTGVEVGVLVADFSDGILSYLREYDPVTDSTENIQPFSELHPMALPNVNSVMADINAWAEVAAARANFYSARDEQAILQPSRKAAQGVGKKAGGGVGPKRITTAALADQMQMLAGQMATLVESQKQLQIQIASSSARDVQGPKAGGTLLGPKLPPLSESLSPPKGITLGKVSQLLGPPPRTKALASGLATTTPGLHQEAEEPKDPLMPEEPFSQEHMLAALTQQSAAVTALVAHITGGGDAMADLHGATAGSLGASTKGLQRRQKMQADLANQSSSFFLQLHQQMHRKMFPAKVVPAKEEDLLGAQVGMCTYLERFGNFRNCREVGMTMWVLSHAVDAAAQGDLHQCREFLALLSFALEQVALDGDWRLAYHLTLLEEPPATMFQGRQQQLSAVGKPFANMVPPSLAAVTLAYIKEVDVLTAKKGEIKGKKQGGGQGDAEEEGGQASPKRKPRFPRKPKNNEGAEA